MEELFRNISDEEGVELVLKHETLFSPFVMSPFTRKPNGTQIKSLSLNIQYKRQLIEVIYKLSNDQAGILSCKISSSKNLPEFQIKNTNPYLRFINSKLKALSIKSEDEVFTNHFENVLSKINLEKIARTVQFEPRITGSNNKNIYEINTAFYLGFSQKKEVLRPLIELYKALIDYGLGSE